MHISMEKVVTEFIARVNGLEFSVKGRITELLNAETDQKYYWSVSHYYCPTENAHLYSPSVRSTKTIKEAEFLLFAYLENFTAIRVTTNEYF
jgi:hypothetical protein